MRLCVDAESKTSTITMFAAVLVAVLFACSGGSTTETTTPPPDQGFSGTYATQVTLVSNTCGPVTVQSLPTVVTHDRTANSVSLLHAGSNYRGTVATDSTFATTPLDSNFGDGFQYRVTIAGRFGNRSFTADATVDRTGNGAACRYVAHWMGMRS
jgi:hypothetical protein